MLFYISFSSILNECFIFIQDRYNQFNKRKADEVDYYGTKYDYKSIMHYGGKAFTSDGSDTIINKETGKAVVKQVF